MTNPIYRYYQPSYAYAVERERDELRAKNERLSRRLEWHEAMAQEVERLNAENERLRAELARWKPAAHEPRDYFDSEAADNA